MLFVIWIQIKFRLVITELEILYTCSVSTTTDSPKLVTSTKVSFLFVGFAEMMCCLDVFDKNWR